MSIRRKLIIVAAIFAALLLFLAFGLPPIVRSVAQDKLTSLLVRKTTIEEVSFNPFTLELGVRGVAVEEQGGGGTFFSLGALKVNLEAVSLFRLAPVVSELRIESPKLSVIRLPDGSYNFSDLLKKEPPKEEPPAKNGEPARFLLENLTLTGGAVRFDNRPASKVHEVEKLELFLPVVSNLPKYVETFSEPRLSLLFDGSPFKLEGKTKPFADSLETSFRLDLKNLDLARYAAYSPVKTGVELARAFLDADLTLAYLQSRDKPPAVTVSGTTALREVEVREVGGAPLLAFSRMGVTLAPSEVSAGKVRVSEITIEKPVASVRREKSGRLNLAAFSPVGETAATKPSEAKPSDAKPSGESPDIRVERIAVREGIISFDDEAAWKPFHTRISGFEAGLTGFDLSAKTFAALTVSFATDAGEKVAAKASGTFEPLDVAAGWEVAGIDLPRYAPYYGENLDFELTGGRFSTTGECTVKDGGKVKVKGAGASVEGLKLLRSGEKTPFLTLAGLSVTGADADLEAKRAEVAGVTVAGLETRAARLPDGTLSTDGLVKTPKAAQPQPSATQAAPAAAPEGGQGWLFTVREIALQKCGASFEDRYVNPPAAFEMKNLAAKLLGFSNESGSLATLTLDSGFSGKARLGLKGRVGIAPVKAELAVKLKDLELVRLNSYVSQAVRLTLIDGELNVDGNVDFSAPPQAQPLFGFRGGVSLVRLKAVDENAEELVSWGALGVNGVNFTNEPQRVSIDSIEFTDPYARITVGPDGTLNLAALKAGPKPPAEAAPAQAEPPAPAPEPAKSEAKPSPVEVGAVSLKGGVIDFSDRKISPNYRTRLIDLAGRVTRMASTDAGGGEVTVLGSVDGYAPLEITGRLNPFSEALMVDLKIDFRNIEMSPMTPYSSRYLGYKIERGKLGLGLAYKINGVKLDSDNKILFDQLTFGDEVESPEATRLPVRFALAILTDRNGMIDLDVPVAGTLDDPEFSYGRIIWKVILNLLVKAVSSPFALIGSLFGGGPELSYAVFDPASAQLPPAEEEKLAKLAKALTERPALRLEVQGHADPEADRLALRDLSFAKKLQAQKVLENARLGNPPVPEEQIAVTLEEYDELLGQVFKREKIPRPAEAAREPTSEEMRKLILTHTVIGEDELRELAGARARSVISRLTADAGVAPARVFLTEPKTIKPEQKEGVADSRVDFVLH